jgi:hypothetical protein
MFADDMIAASPSAEMSGDATAGYAVYLAVYLNTYRGDLIIPEAGLASKQLVLILELEVVQPNVG